MNPAAPHTLCATRGGGRKAGWQVNKGGLIHIILHIIPC